MQNACIHVFLVLEIMQKLEEFEPRPKMHTSLVHSVLRPRTHRKVCDSDINAHRVPARKLC